MKFQHNPYYSPELCGLRIFQEIDTGASYEFHMFVIWEKLDDKTLHYDTDSGCSCPSPFDPEDNGHDLKPITESNFNSFEMELKNHDGIEMTDVINTISKVKDHMRLK